MIVGALLIFIGAMEFFVGLFALAIGGAAWPNVFFLTLGIIAIFIGMQCVMISPRCLKKQGHRALPAYQYLFLRLCAILAELIAQFVVWRRRNYVDLWAEIIVDEYAIWFTNADASLCQPYPWKKCGVFMVHNDLDEVNAIQRLPVCLRNLKKGDKPVRVRLKVKGRG